MRTSSKLPLMAVLAGLAGIGQRYATAVAEPHASLKSSWVKNLPTFAYTLNAPAWPRKQFKRNQRRQGNRKVMAR